MSQPKKKVSRARRDKRRYALGNRIDRVEWTTYSVNDGELVRPHRVTLDTAAEYVKMRQKHKAEAKAAN